MRENRVDANQSRITYEESGVDDESGIDAEADPDEVTGASPGTAQACSELGLNSLAANLERFGIKPPGQS